MQRVRWICSPAAYLLLVLLACGSVAAGETELTFGGYLKFDAMISDYSDGEPGDDSLLRDFHVPGAIPVGGTGESPSTAFHAKESRFNVKLAQDTDGGHQLSGFFEVDFLLSASGDERVSNSYNPRLRHAYLTYDGWLVGQTWSTFMIIALPEDLDFIGVADGTTFERGPQIRLTRGPWQFSLENPETTLTPNGGGARITSDDGLLPDVIARYNLKRDRGTLSVATMLRQLELDEGTEESRTTGWGASVGGRWGLGSSDDVRFQLTTGSGIGRHLALNTANGASIALDGDLEAIESTAGFVGLRHVWNDRWRSNFNVAAFSADHELALAGDDVTHRTHSVSINTLCSPVPDLTVGVEFMHAERELLSGASGEMDRLQFSATYSFSFSPERRRTDDS